MLILECCTVLFPPHTNKYCLKPGTIYYEARTLSFVPSPWGIPATNRMDGSFSRISLHERKGSERERERLSFSVSFIRLNIPRNIYLPAGYVAFFFSSPLLPSLPADRDTWTRVFHRGRGHYWMEEGDSVLLALPCAFPSPTLANIRSIPAGRRLDDFCTMFEVRWKKQK